MAGLTGVIGASGCATPFDPISTPNPDGGNGTSETPQPTETPTPEPTETSVPEPERTSTPEQTETSSPTPEPPKTRSGAALTGVYPGGDSLASTLSTFSNWLSQKPAVVMVFVDAFGSRAAKKGFIEGPLTDIWKAGHVPLISWQPFARRKQATSETIERAIARGRRDKQIRTWATLLDRWARPRGEESRGRRVYFRPAHEMNGNWFPWSAVDSSRITAIPASTSRESGEGENPTTGTPEDYVGMWRQLHGIFAKTKLDETNIQWIWSPNVDELGGISAERYYPGDEFVDWVGLDGFNFGSSQSSSSWESRWRSPEQLFDQMLNRIRELTDKPVALTEFASSSAVDSGSETEYRPENKAQWIRDVFSYVKTNDIKMTCWFDVDKTGPDESDWAIFGGERGTSWATIDGEQYRVYEDYKRTVLASDYLAALPDYPPLLTDDEFAGEF